MSSKLFKIDLQTKICQRKHFLNNLRIFTLLLNVILQDLNWNSVLLRNKTFLIAFYAKMNHFLKKKDGCLICVNKLALDQLFASTKLIASPWAGLTKQLYKQFPKRTVICTSSYKYLVVNYMWIYKCICEWNYKLIYI